MKIYFVEGVDGSGKTTLIKNLCKDYKDVVTYTTPPKDWTWVNQTEMWEEFLSNIRNKNNNCNIVLLDRSPISELIYRMIIDKSKPYINLFEFAQLMDEYQIQIIYCKSETAFKDAEERGEDYIEAEEKHLAIEGLYESFMQTMRMFGVRVVEYYWHCMPIDALYDKIKEDIK